MKEEQKTVESQDLKLEETVETSTTIEKHEIPQEKTPEPERIPLTPDQRLEVLQEISVLSSLANTTQFVPHFDQGNGGKQKPKLTKSTTLNLLDYEQLMQVKKHLVNLINLL